MDTALAIGVLFLSSVGAALGSYVTAALSGYGSKSGELRAIKDQIGVVLEQLKLTTRAAEEIKASIGEEFWVRQEQWKLKRDTYLPAVPNGTARAGWRLHR
jgi:hypothetical protein